MPDQLPLYQDVRWILTTVIAIWGAGLSTLSAVRARQSQSARLKVRFGPSIMESGNGTPRPVMYGVFVDNVGQIDVHFERNRAFIRLKGSSEPMDLFFEPPDDAPTLVSLLKPGQSFIAHLSRADFNFYVARDIGDVDSTVVQGGVVDAVGRRFLSKATRVEPIDVNDRRTIHGLFVG